MYKLKITQLKIFVKIYKFYTDLKCSTVTIHSPQDTYNYISL